MTEYWPTDTELAHTDSVDIGRTDSDTDPADTATGLNTGTAVTVPTDIDQLDSGLAYTGLTVRLTLTQLTP